MPYLKHKPKSLESAVSKIQENEYEKVFRKALKKYNVDSPDELETEKKKKFFNYVDSIYTAKGESTRLGAAAQGVKKYQKEASADDSEDG